MYLWWKKTLDEVENSQSISFQVSQELSRVCLAWINLYHTKGADSIILRIMNMKRKRFYLNKIITFNSSNFNKSFFDRKIKVKTDKEKNSMEIPPSGRVSLLILSHKSDKKQMIFIMMKKRLILRRKLEGNRTYMWEYFKCG